MAVESGHRCWQCDAENPAFARFCHRCCAPLEEGAGRAQEAAFAVQPGEQVSQLALISSLMPHANRRAANRYRWALAVGGAAVVVMALTGLLPAAIAAAAVLLPAAYVIYLADARLWQDTPWHVLAAVLLGTAVLAFLTSALFFLWLFPDALSALLRAAGTPGGLTAVPLIPLVLFAVLLPVIGELARNAGPIALARLPQFDDMIDGFAFGVASGMTYAGVETLVALAPVFSGSQLQTSDNLAAWFPLVLNMMVVKPVVYGAATGIAVAAFSGRGDGYAGFTRSYFSALALAMGTTVLYWLGIRALTALSPAGHLLTLVWGVIIAAVLLILARRTLQTALLESAIEDVRAGHYGKLAAAGDDACPECDMPLVPGAAFCASCGASVRATSGRYGARARRQRAPSATSPLVEPPGEPTNQAGPGLRGNTPLLLVLIALLAAGGIGLGSAAVLGSGSPDEPTADAEAAFLLAEVVAGVQLPDATGVIPEISLPTLVEAQPGHIVLQGGAVAFPVPPGWRRAAGDGETWALLTSGDEVWVLVATVSVDRQSAADVLQSAAEQLINRDGRLGQLRQSSVQPLPVFGRLLERARLSYGGLAADPQAARQLWANLYAGVRNDGVGIVMDVRNYNPARWSEAAAGWHEQLYRPMWEAFAGAAMPAPGVPSLEVE